MTRLTAIKTSMKFLGQFVKKLLKVSELKHLLIHPPISVIQTDIPSTVNRMRNKIFALKLSVGFVNLSTNFSAIRPIRSGSIIIAIIQKIGKSFRIVKATSALNSPTAKMAFTVTIKRTVSVQIIAPNNAPSFPFLGNLVSCFSSSPTAYFRPVSFTTYSNNG